MLNPRSNFERGVIISNVRIRLHFCLRQMQCFLRFVQVSRFACIFACGKCNASSGSSECRDSLAFLPAAKIIVSLGLALASNTPPECCNLCSNLSIGNKKIQNNKSCSGFFGPSVEIRTRGLLNPIQARYQTSPHPDQCLRLTTASIYYHTLSENASTFFKIFKKFFIRPHRT